MEIKLSTTATNFAQLAFTNLLTKYLHTNKIAKLDLGFLTQSQSVGATTLVTSACSHTRCWIIVRHCFFHCMQPILVILSLVVLTFQLLAAFQHRIKASSHRVCDGCLNLMPFAHRRKIKSIVHLLNPAGQPGQARSFHHQKAIFYGLPGLRAPCISF